MYTVNTLSKYLKWEHWFIENGYRPWQYQYDIDSPEGLHVWFCKNGSPDIEVVTNSLEIKNAILSFPKAAKIE